MTLKRYLFAAVVLAVAVPLFGQPAERSVFRTWRSEVEIQGYQFENFFQSRGGVPEQDIGALGVEYRTAYKQNPNAADVFGAIFATNYSETGTPTSFGGRAGFAKYGAKHSFYGYLERTENGYSFETDRTRVDATITALLTAYSYRLADDWQVGINTYNDFTRFDESTGFESDFYDVEGEVRYRHFGRIFEPRVSFAIGQQDVRNKVDSYDYKHWSFGISSRPNPRVDLAIRYRMRNRDYTAVDREEDRDQIQLRGSFRYTERVGITGSYIHEDTSSSRPNNDYNTSRLYVGLIYGF